MKTFEYDIVTSTGSDEEDVELLNDKGGEGWELVTVHVSEVTYIEGEDEDDEDAEEYTEEVVRYFLKREKSA